LTYLAALLAAFFFAVALRAMKLVPLASKALATAGAAARTMKDPALSEDVKAVAARRAALDLMRQSASMSFRAVGAAAAGVLPVAAFSAAGLTSWATVGHVLSTWPGIAAACGATLIAFIRLPPWR
jgi:hypothetical protein